MRTKTLFSSALLIITHFAYICLFNLSLYAEDNFQTFSEEGPSLQIRGYIKELFTLYPTDQYGAYMQTSGEKNEKNLIANLNRIRLSPEFEYRDILLVHVDYDNEIITGNYLKSTEFDLFWRTNDYNELIDFTYEPHYSQDIYYRTKIHNAYAKVIFGDLTATIGRQQIRFGSGRLWNPLDIFNPISPTEIEGAEEQKGTDALRLEYYPAMSTEITLAIAPKRVEDDIKKTDAEHADVISRIKTTIENTDLAVLGGRVSRRYMAGGDISYILFDGMLTASILYSSPEYGEPFFQGHCGYEYNFRSGIYFLAEYFYNENGLNYNQDLMTAYFIIYGGFDNLLSEETRQEYYERLSGRFLTFNQHYTGIAIGYDITPLLRGDLFSIYDFQGTGVFVTPSLKYNALQNLDVSVACMYAYKFDDDKKYSDFEYLDKYGLYYGAAVWYF